MARKARFVLIAAAAAMLLALVAAHSSPVRALVLRRLVDTLRSSYGIDVRAKSLSYNLLTLSAELRGIEVASVDAPAEPFAVAEAIGVSLGARTLIGDVTVRRLTIASPRIDIRRRADGTDNLPRVTRTSSNGGSMVLPPIRVDDLGVSFQQPSASAVLHGAAFELTNAAPGRFSASIKAAQGMTLTAGDRRIDLDAVAAAADLDGERLTLRELTASRPGTQVDASGSVALRGDASTVDMTVHAWSELESWSAAATDEAFPAGRVDATARVTGLLSDPTITVETSSTSLAWSGIEGSAIEARGTYRDGQLSLNTITLAIAGGTATVTGTIALDDTSRASRIEARWENLDVRHIPGAEGLAGTISKNGTATLQWRAEGTAKPRFEVTATTGIVASGKTTPIVVRGSGQGDRWRVEVSPRDAGAIDVTAAADIGLDAQRWQSSTITGQVVLRTTDLPAAIRQAQDLGLPASVDPGTAAGAIDVDATIGGTLGAVRSTGRINGRGLTIAGLPLLDLEASFGADIARKTSTGSFRLIAAGLESARLVSQEDVTLGGSLLAAGTWSGPVSDPTVDATLTGRNLTIARGGSVPLHATGGTFDAVLKGPATKLAGQGTLTIGSVDVGGHGAGGVTADFTVADRTLRVQARAPEVKTTLDGAIGLERPNAFDGRATVADHDIEALLDMAGLAVETGAVRGRISSAFAFKGDLENASAATVTVDVAPLEATAFDVPIVMSRGLHATTAGGRVEIDSVMMTVGGVALRVGGALAPNQSGGTLAVDVDGDLDGLKPWLARLSGSGDVAAAGRVSGHLETQRSSAGLKAIGNIETTLSTLSKGDRLLARDVSAAVVLTGQRAELRQATGSVLGGQITAAGDVPLTWLNRWLPSGFQIASPEIDRPATLEGKASFDVRALLSAIGRAPLEDVDGGVDASYKLSASTPAVSSLDGALWLDRAEVRARELRYAQSDVTRFRLADGALSVERLEWRGSGSQLVGRGSLGLVKGVETDLRLDVDTELAIVGALLSGRAAGRLQGNLELRGEVGALRVTSDATLSNASWLIPGQRILFAGWSGHVRLEDQALSVTKLGGTVNGGSIAMEGRLPLEPGAAGGDLRLTARDILIDVPRGLHSQIGADLVWQRADRSAQLQGKVEVTSNRYTEPVTRILQLVNELSSATRRSGASTLPPWLAETALDIALVVTDPILIDNSVSTVELMPDLHLAGTIDSPALSGRVDVVDQGRITIGGRTYRLRDSQLRFAPADGLLPTLDAVGDTRIGDYDVTLRINGTPDRIETSFSSVPPLGERELQTLIVTGQAGEQTTQSRQSDDNFAAGAAATDILGFAGRFVGLDSVRIGAADLDLVSKDVTTAQHLTVSKSLGSAFDLIFSDNLEDGSVTWVLVWKPTPLNEIRASSVEDGTRALEYRRSLTFGPGSPSGTTQGRAAPRTSRTVVDAVHIVGTPGFSEKELTGKLEIDTGNQFDVRRWIEDRHRLEAFYLDHGYHRVRIASSRRESADRSRVELTYQIERGPRTIIETTGDDLPGEIVDEMYETWRGLPIADVVRTEFERIAREGLARRGYYQPTLRIDFPVESPELARVTLNVARGPQTKDLTIAWSGNREVTNADLDTLVAPHREESKAWLDSEALSWQVRQLYGSRGYLQAQVTVGAPLFQDTVATLPMTIDEGVLSRLVDVQLEGVDASRMTGARDALGLSIGAPVAASAPVEAGRRLKAFYAGLGYRRATATQRITTAKDGSVSLAWTVQEGPLYRIKDVTVVGPESTNDGLVRKAITVAPGEVMSQSAIDTTRRNLYDIGSFRRVDFDFGDSAIQPGATGDLPLPLTIQAEELQRFQLKYGVQYSFDRSSGKGGGTALGGSVELRDRNFIGRAVQASVGAHWDPDLQIAGMLLSSPRIFGKGIRTNVYLRDRREQEVLDSSSMLEGATLDDRRRELTVEQRWRPASTVELVWGYKFSSRLFLLDRNEEHREGGGLLAGPIVSIILDRRDSPFDATRGMFHSSSFQFGVESLGSELGYVRYLLRQSYYQPLGKLTAAGSVRYGTIRQYSGTVPLSIIDLFFEAGGTSTVRGYPEDSLSAVNIAGFELGGPELLVLNGEVRFPVSKRFGGAVFVDAGNTFRSGVNPTWNGLALGAGVGLRVRTPLAPLRLDIAHPFSNELGRSGVRVHFSIGQIF